MHHKTYVWDIFIRFFHWSLVLAFVISYATGDEFTSLHVAAGYVILALLFARLVWGLVGSRYARFSHFSFKPTAVRAYLKALVGLGRPQHYVGHNPAGSWMAVALLVCLTLTGISGLKVYGLEGYGPMASTTPDAVFMQIDSRASDEVDDEDSEELWEAIHEFLANLTVLLISLHIAGVLLSSFRGKENLIAAMINGYKQSNSH